MSSKAQPISIAAIIPAAGQSRRMGREKILMPVGGRSLLAQVTGPLAQAGVTPIVVVTRPDLQCAVEAAALPHVHVALNPDPASHMIDSIRLGLKALEQATSSTPPAAVLICPADRPGLRPELVQNLAAALANHPGQIIVATHHGRRGHPIVVPAALLPLVHSPLCDAGLKQLLASGQAPVYEVSAPGDDSTLGNLNTPEDVAAYLNKKNG